jgi:NAD(P)H-dependent FMN reductase
MSVTEQAGQLHVAAIYGSVRPERQGIRAARFVVNELTARGHRVTLVDPLEKRLPLLERMYKEYPSGDAPAILTELAELYRAVDGFAIVSGEYNHGVPPALKNLLDYFLEEYLWRPAVIVSYSGGRFAGVRAAMSLRSILAELGMVTIPSTLPIGQVGEVFDERGAPLDERIRPAAAEVWGEFEWYMRALRAARMRGTPE